MFLFSQDNDAGTSPSSLIKPANGQLIEDGFFIRLFIVDGLGWSIWILHGRPVNTTINIGSTAFGDGRRAGDNASKKFA